MRHLLYRLMILSVTFIIYSCETEKAINIGVVVPLTGDYAEYGKNIKTALEIGLEDISKMNNQYKYRLIFEDDQAQPKAAVSAINKLIYTDKVKYIIGGFTSASSVAMYPIAEKNKVILFSPSSSTPELSENTPYFFRNWPSDEIQAKEYASYTYNDFGKKKVSTVYSISDYGVFANKIFCETFLSLGGEVLGQYGYYPNTKDFKTMISKIISENPDAVWLFGYYSEMGVFLKQAKNLGLNTQFFGQEGIEGEDLIKTAGDGANGLIYFVPYFDASTDEAKQFISSYKKVTGHKPEVFGAHAYDVLMIYYNLIEKYGNNSDDIALGIPKIKNYEGLSGSISFDAEGNAVQDLMIKIIKEQKFTEYDN